MCLASLSMTLSFLVGVADTPPCKPPIPDSARRKIHLGRQSPGAPKQTKADWKKKRYWSIRYQGILCRSSSRRTVIGYTICSGENAQVSLCLRCCYPHQQHKAPQNRSSDLRVRLQSCLLWLRGIPVSAGRSESMGLPVYNWASIPYGCDASQS